MRTHPRATRAALRRAVWASAALHAVAAAAVLLLLWADRPVPQQPVGAIDTRAPTVQMYLTETAEAVEIHQPEQRLEPPAPAAPPAPQPDTPPPPAAPEATPPVSTSPGGPFAVRPPHTLPPDLAARVRQASAPAAAAPAPDPNVKPVGATAVPGAAFALHGALKSGQVVVYLLDASGSMGAAGKFARARAAVAATLAGQPEGARFQVFVYDWSAWPLAPGATVPATPASVQAVAAQLAAVEPRGRSNHLAALRAALDARPDAVVWLTDADDLPATALAPVRKAAGRPVPVYVGLVTPEGVQQPRELK